MKSFDHSKTKFPLVVAHKQVACSKCHAGERYAGLATTCVSCHSLQDKHAGSNGSNCETCHAPNKWTTVSFDHDKATRFALRGGHAKLACERCHTSNARRDRLATNGVACHRKNDPHKGQLGPLASSATRRALARRWPSRRPDRTFLGLHAAVPCEQCQEPVLQRRLARLRQLPQGRAPRRPPRDQLHKLSQPQRLVASAV